MARDFTPNDDLQNSSTPSITGYPFTFACQFWPDDASTIHTLMALSIHNSSTRGRLIAQGVAPNDPILLELFSGGASSLASSNGFTAGQWNTAIAIANSSSEITLYLNGTKTGPTSVTARDIFSGTLTRTSIGVTLVASVEFNNMNGRIAEAAIWDVVLTDDEAAAFAANFSPRFIRPQSLQHYWPLIGKQSPEPDLGLQGFPMTVTGAVQIHHCPVLNRSQNFSVTPAAGGVTSTGAQTLPSLSQAGAAVQEIPGAAAQTLPGLSQAASAVEGFTATGVQTLPALAQSGAGTSVEINAGTGAQTLAAATQNASAVEEFVATGAQTLASMTQNGAGVETITSSCAQTVPALSQAGAAEQEISGASAQTLPSATQAGAAEQFFAGTGVQTLAAIVQAASALQAFVGTGIQTLASLTQAGAGIHIEPAIGTAVQTLPAVTQSGAGLETILTTGTQALPAIVQSGSGSHVDQTTSTGAQALPAATQAGAGIEEQAGTGAQALPAVVQSGAGVEKYVGTGSQILPTVVQNGDALMQPEATGVQTLAKLAQAASVALIFVGSGAQNLAAMTQQGAASEIITSTASAVLPAVSQQGALAQGPGPNREIRGYDFNLEDTAIIADATVYGAALTHSSTGSNRTTVDSSGVMVTKAANLARFDHDRLTPFDPRGYLSDKQKANFGRQSEAFDDAAWISTNVTHNANVSSPVDVAGNQTVEQIVETTANGAHVKVQTFSAAVDNIAYNFPFFFKKGTRRWFLAQVLRKDGVLISTWFDSDNMAVGTDETGTANVEEWSNGWGRAFMLMNVLSGGTTPEIRYGLADADASAVYTGSTSENGYLSKAQIEFALATSYHGATTANDVRGGDKATVDITGESLATGAMFWEGIVSEDSGILAQADDGTANNRIYFRRIESPVGVNGDVRFIVVSGGIEQVNINLGSVPDFVRMKIAASWAANDFKAAMNGAAAATDTSGTVPSGLTTFRVAVDHADVDQPQCWTSKTNLYDEPKSAAFIEDLTSGDAMATAAQTLPGLSESGSAGMVPEATAAQTLPSIAQDATGGMVREGDGAQALPALAQEGTGAETFASTGAQILGAATQAAIGLQQPEATSAQALPSMVQAGIAEETEIGTGAQVLPAVAQQGVLIQAQTGTAAIVLPVMLQSGAAAIVLPGTGALALPALLQAGVAEILIQGTAQSLLPAVLQQSFEVTPPRSIIAISARLTGSLTMSGKLTGPVSLDARIKSRIDLQGLL
jgi:hypothetical protein